MAQMTAHRGLATRAIACWRTNGMPHSYSERVHNESLRAISLIANWPVVNLGAWPTPIQIVQHSRLGQLLVKRDDLARFGRGGTSGVKARKLEGFLAHVSRNRYQQVMILLANMTNLGHDIIPALTNLSVRTRLLIVNDPVLGQSQREHLFRNAEATVEFLGPSHAAGTIRLAAAALQAKMSGVRSIAVLPSPAHPSAVIGAARGLIEVVQQCQASGQALPCLVFISSAAGTTAAGFILASSVLRAAGVANIRVMAVPVVPYRVENWLPLLLYSAQRTLGLRMRMPLPDYGVLRVPRNLSYGRFDNYLEAVCTRVQDTYDLVIDPIYGAKSWSAMEEYVSSANLAHGNPVMFWHCGYSPDWEAFRNC